MRSVSVVVPVFNAQATLVELVSRLDGVLSGRGADYEIILVNDGSSDESWSRTCEAASKSDHIVGLGLARNFGQHNALLAGIRKARKQVIVTLDYDLQNPPEEILRLLAELDRGGHDVVYGAPESLAHEGWRSATSLVTKWALRAFMGADTAQKVTAFRAFRSSMRNAFRGYRGSFVSVDVLLTWRTTRFGSVSVRHGPRLHGSSNYTIWRLLRKWWWP